MNIIPLTDVTQAEDIIQMFAQLSKEKKGNRYSIFLAETGDLIGTCGFNQLDADNDRGEIGYELGEPYLGPWLYEGSAYEIVGSRLCFICIKSG